MVVAVAGGCWAALSVFFSLRVSFCVDEAGGVEEEEGEEDSRIEGALSILACCLVVFFVWVSLFAINCCVLVFLLALGDGC